MSHNTIAVSHERVPKPPVRARATAAAAETGLRDAWMIPMVAVLAGMIAAFLLLVAPYA
jgi:hypothetical protein